LSDLSPGPDRVSAAVRKPAALATAAPVFETDRPIVACLGMSFWKRRRVAEFLGANGDSPQFCRTAEAAIEIAGARGGAVAVWASRMPSDLAEMATRNGIPLVRVEDGFIRSVGLGSDFLPPVSLVFDRGGMYYDPRSRSDLETILAGTVFDAALRERARLLAEKVVRQGVTKYNLAAGPASIAWPAGKPRILVPGQVEDDLSVRFGGGGIRSNLELLQQVRGAQPDAFIVFKPHPDVLAGHRIGAVPEAAARRLADLIVEDVSTAALLDEIHEVHTLTSLTGFEALLRGKRVVCYGTPFYAGWGLTEDASGIDRGRRLALDELVAGTLILYPRYLDPVTRQPCGPELIVDRLETPELWRTGPLVRLRRLQGVMARGWRELISACLLRFAR